MWQAKFICENELQIPILNSSSHDMQIKSHLQHVTVK